MRRSTASLLYLLLGVFGGIGFSFYCGYCAGSSIEDTSCEIISKDAIIKDLRLERDLLKDMLHDTWKYDQDRWLDFYMELDSYDNLNTFYKGDWGYFYSK